MARKTSVLCSACGKLISVEETKCPYCGALRPALFGFAPALRGLFGDRLDLVHLIVVACVGLYVVSLALDPDAILGSRGILGIGSPSTRALFLLGMTGSVATTCGFWWTVLTANFLHGGILHIVFNILWIRSLGPVAVQMFGQARFFVLYMVTGVAGFVLSNLLWNTPTIGASAAIFGLMGVVAGWGRRRGGRWFADLSFEMWRWAAFVVVLGFVVGGVNNTAHIGGFATGFALSFVLPRREGRRETRTWQVLALVLLVATVAAFGLSVWTGLDAYRTGVPLCWARVHG